VFASPSQPWCNSWAVRRSWLPRHNNSHRFIRQSSNNVVYASTISDSNWTGCAKTPHCSGQITRGLIEIIRLMSIDWDDWLNTKSCDLIEMVYLTWIDWCHSFDVKSRELIGDLIWCELMWTDINWLKYEWAISSNVG
jgi:hypothetical protein